MVASVSRMLKHNSISPVEKERDKEIDCMYSLRFSHTSSCFWWVITPHDSGILQWVSPVWVFVFFLKALVDIYVYLWVYTNVYTDVHTCTHARVQIVISDSQVKDLSRKLDHLPPAYFCGLESHCSIICFRDHSLCLTTWTTQTSHMCHPQKTPLLCLLVTVKPE